MKQAILQRFYAFFHDTALKNPRSQVSSNTFILFKCVAMYSAVYKAFCGMDVARKAVSLHTAIPSFVSHHSANFMSFMNFY